jgi:hypothetical protein
MNHGLDGHDAKTRGGGQKSAAFECTDRRPSHARIFFPHPTIFRSQIDLPRRIRLEIQGGEGINLSQPGYYFPGSRERCPDPGGIKSLEDFNRGPVA